METEYTAGTAAERTGGLPTIRSCRRRILPCGRINLQLEEKSHAHSH